MRAKLKLAIEFFFASVLVIYLSASYALSVPSLNIFFKEKIEHVLSRTFDRRVTIGEIEGSFMSLIVAKDVVVFNREGYTQDILATVDYMNVYSSFRVIFGNVLSSILRIEFDTVVLNVERNLNHKVNILEFSNMGTHKGKGRFVGKLTFKDISGQYVDSKEGARGFRQGFEGGEAEILFEKEKGVGIDVSAMLTDTQTICQLQGGFQFKEREFQYSFSFDGVDAVSWGRYLVPGNVMTFGSQLVLVKGTLLREYHLGTDARDLKYDIDFLFDDLQLSHARLSEPFKDIRGKLRVTNMEGESLVVIEDIHGSIKGHEVQALGNVFFGQKEYDVFISPMQTIAVHEFLSLVSIDASFIPNVSVTMNVNIKGRFDRPVISTILYNDEVQFEGVSLGTTHVAFDYVDDQFYIQSMSDSDVVVSGNINQEHIQANIRFMDILVPFVATPQSVVLEVSGTAASPNIYGRILDMEYDVYGNILQSVDMHAAFVDGQWRFSNGGLHFLNGQSILYEGELDVDSQVLSLVQLPFISTVNVLTGPMFNMVESQFSVNFLDIKGTLSSHIALSGKQARVNSVWIDTYDIVIDSYAHKKTVDIRKCLIGQQSLYGTAEIEDARIVESKIWGRSIDLSLLNEMFSTFNTYDISGIATGYLFYKQESPLPNIKAKINIERLVSMFGLFGTVSIDLESVDGGIMMKSLELRDLHSGSFSGVFRSLDEYEVKTNRYSWFKLNALDFFKTHFFSGIIGVDGGFIRKKEDWVYNGKGDVKNLELDGISFPYGLVSGQFSRKKMVIQQSKFVFEQGEIMMKGDVRGSGGAKMLLDPVEYSLDVRFNSFQLKDLSNVFYLYNKIGVLAQRESLDVSMVLDPLVLYSKYTANSSGQFIKYVSNVKDTQKLDAKVPILGRLNGDFYISNRDQAIGHVALRLNDFRWRDWFEIAELQVDSLDDLGNAYLFRMKDIVYHQQMLENVNSVIRYNRESRVVAVQDMRIKYQKKWLRDWGVFSYDLDRRYIEGSILLKGEDINVVSFFVPQLKSLSNQGRIQMRFKGPLDKVQVTFPSIDLNQFSMVFDPNHSFFNSRVMIDQFKANSQMNKLLLNGLKMRWVGANTYRRVTRAEKVNTLDVSGDIFLYPINFLDQKSLDVEYELRFQPTFMSVNFPNIYTGDILFSTSTVVGRQSYPLSKKGKAVVVKSLGTQLETGPIFSSSMVFQDGVFNLPKMGGGVDKIRLGLDLNVTLGDATYIQGSVFGDGIYNLANRVSLEVSSVMKEAPFHVTGMLNAQQYSAKIFFYDGSITMFDGVYTLLNNAQQRHFFKEIPEYISDQYIEVLPVQLNEKRFLDYRMHLNAIWIKDRLETGGILDNQFLYDGVAVVLDGSLETMLSDFTVIEFGLASQYSVYPKYEMKGVHAVNLRNQDAMSTGVNYGLGLIMPSFLTDESANFSHFGRQQVNTFVKSSIRPYERRLAKRFGLYDLRIDYDFGKSLFYSEDREEANSDLLGVTVTSDLHKERLFLDLRSDYNLSPESNRTAVSGIKLTQLEFKYFMSDNMTVGLKNVNEYSETMTFDPRFSLSYGYVF
jgi:hypothetical protein